MIEFAVLHLVMLHTIDGRETFVSPDQVVSMSSHKPDEPNKLLHEGVECILGLTNGKIVSVSEPCELVKQLLEDAK